MIRQQIECLRFVLVAGLVMLHYGSFPESELSPFRGWVESAHPVAAFVNSFVLFFFLSAVPLLSAISGWLFFKDFVPSAPFYLRRIRARGRSVLLPMALWNGIVLAGFAAVAMAGVTGWPLAIVAYDMTALGFSEIIDALLGITRHPVNFQFWFLRDLFLTVLLSPILGLVLARAPLVGAVVLGAVWFAGFDLWIFFRTDVLFFFYLGGFLRVRGIPVAHRATGLGLALMALFLLLVTARTIGPRFIAEDSGLGILLFDYGARLMRAVGVAGLWLSAPLLVATPLGQALARLGPTAFFLHAFHWPLNQFVKEGLARLLPPEGDAALIANYLATGLLTVALAILAARMLDRLWPALFGILSGGREGFTGRPRLSVLGQTGG